MVLVMTSGKALRALRMKKKCMDKGPKERKPSHNLRQNIVQYIISTESQDYCLLVLVYQSLRKCIFEIHNCLQVLIDALNVSLIFENEYVALTVTQLDYGSYTIDYGDDVDGGVGWLWEWRDNGDVVVTRWQQWGGHGGVEMKVMVAAKVAVVAGVWPESGRRLPEAAP
ncbi:hypothetical protein Tco_1302779 [Tanacetum coccineum]